MELDIHIFLYWLNKTPKLYDMIYYNEELNVVEHNESAITCDLKSLKY